jgi:hypothetical protein
MPEIDLALASGLIDCSAVARQKFCAEIPDYFAVVGVEKGAELVGLSCQNSILP